MSITLSYDVDQCVIGYPTWEGYYSKAVLAIEPVELEYGYEIHDNGISYDYRVCIIDRSILTETEADNLETFIYNHRGLDINMAIGTDSNFFPFGPDLGDTGTFVVKILGRSFGPFDQFKQFDKSWELLLITEPAYLLPNVNNQDSFQIGTVDGLLYPQAGINPNRDYGIKHSLSYNGTNYFTDKRDDIHTTSFTQVCNEGLAAQLFQFLTGASGRDQDITIIAPDDYYLFGPKNSAGGTFTCRLIQKEIECRQLNYEEFEIPLNFFMVNEV